MSLKILLVEDNDLAQRLGVMLLTSLKHQVDKASTGNEALEKFFNVEYDLVFMDIGLPDMDGLEVTRRIRERNQTTPIIALTAHDEGAKKQDALAAGMSDYLVKPITAENAQEIFTKWIKH
jgi:two-component system aerobic respiration control sensor histidine kinase ArcB